MIAGEEDQGAKTVSFRFRNGDQKNGVPIDDAIAMIKNSISNREQV
jgi:threonyl-tRNA synthetase